MQSIARTQRSTAWSKAFAAVASRRGSYCFPSVRFLGITYFMAKSKKVKPKKRGRPATGKDPLMGFRASPEMRASVVRWAENEPDTPTLSEAIRRLVEIGLKTKLARKPARSARAAELAAAQIEKMIDPATSADERAQRRRRLTKGPPEFREDRVDLPKAKK